MGTHITRAAFLFLISCFVLCGISSANVLPGCSDCPPMENLYGGPIPELVTSTGTATSFALAGTCAGFTSVTIGSNYVTLGGGQYSADVGEFALNTNIGTSSMDIVTGITTENSDITTHNSRSLSFVGTSAIASDSFFLSRCDASDNLSYCEDVEGSSLAIITNGQYSTILNSILSNTNGIGLEYQFGAGATANSSFPGMNGQIASHFTTNQEYGEGAVSSITRQNDIRSHMDGVSLISGSFSFNTLRSN